MNKTITVDGPAGSGKSSIAKLLSKRINYTYLDTGAIYRILTYCFIEEDTSARDKQKIESTLATIKINIEDSKYYLNDKDVTEVIRGEAVDKLVAVFAQLPEVRGYVRSFQRRMADNKNMVIDGRDIGTEVFPNAFCKFYLDARLKVRAERRFNDLKKREIIGERTLEDIAQEVARRDKMDRERTHSPLKIPKDALIIDSSDSQIESVLEEMVNHYNNKIQLQSLDTNFSSDEQNEEFFKAMQEQPAAPTTHSGEFLDAKVISIGEEIYLDIGRKVDAYISHDEVKRLGEINFAVGDTIQVVEKARTRVGVLVSKYDADRWQGLLKLRERFKANDLVSGIVKDINKGGYIIDIDGTEAFCPLSEYDVVKSPRKQDEIGVHSNFKILSLDLKNVIVSRKRPLEKRYDTIRQEFFETAKENDRFTAKVVHLMNYRMIVSLKEGVNAIIRQKEFSWKRSGRDIERFQRGDEFEVVLILIDREKQRLEVSRRLAQPDPFIDFYAKHEVGSVVTGKIVSTERYGVFVEVENGVDGMVHISDISWFRKVLHPKDLFNIGDAITTKILSISKEDRKLSLGIKQLEADPWESMDQTYPIGGEVNLKITAIIKNGLYGLIDEKVDAFIHIMDTQYKDTQADFMSIFNVGDDINAKILRVNKFKHRLELGLKEKIDNPWEELKLNFDNKDVVMGEVVEIIENGVNVKLLGSVIGFCHVNQLDEVETKSIEDVVKVGEKHSFLIQFIDIEKEKISLSRKDFLISSKNMENSNVSPKMKLDAIIEPSHPDQDSMKEDTDSPSETDRNTHEKDFA
ncbi:30S ribosomal protein S1 [Spirochaetota bacterium]|nr:30S ribosomal protein S1 [Spirochaetota bacterium]